MRRLPFHPSILTRRTPAIAWQVARDPLRFLPTKPAHYRQLLTRLADDVATLTAPVAEPVGYPRPR